MCRIIFSLCATEDPYLLTSSSTGGELSQSILEKQLLEYAKFVLNLRVSGA